MKNIVLLASVLLLVGGGCLSLGTQNSDETISPIDSEKDGFETICVDRCGDGECAEVVCAGEGCPCAETTANCAQDCSAAAAESSDNNPSMAKFLDAQASLKDVTSGPVRGVTTDGNALGVASYVYTEDDGYQLHAEVERLPEPKNSDFYEGWIVRKSPLSVVSTGKLIRRPDGRYTNDMDFADDMRDHVRYVLTLEPDDGDPAPADHIVDGVFEKLQ